MLGARNQAVGMTFAEVGITGVALARIFMIVGRPETGLKEATLSHHQILAMHSEGGCNNNSRIPETDSRDPETETGMLVCLLI